jgi:DNA invertase Pin-like site-specific DNA recombinase
MLNERLTFMKLCFTFVSLTNNSKNKGVMQKFVTYFRVSTKKQGQSGLGIDAQKTIVQNYLFPMGENAQVVAEFTEIESGGNNDREKLNKAVELCKKENAILLVAVLDRLSREADFILILKKELEKAKTKFICCNLPECNTLTLGIYATMAQHEKEQISKRTKLALAEKKKQGVKLGVKGAENLAKSNAQEKSILKIKENAKNDPANLRAFSMITVLLKTTKNLSEIARQLNAGGFKTRNGKDFNAQLVKNVLKVFEEQSN